MQPFVSDNFNSKGSIVHQSGSTEIAIGSQSPQSGSTFGGTQPSSLLGNQPSSVFGGGTTVGSLFGTVKAESTFSSRNTGTSAAMPQTSFGDSHAGSIFGSTSSRSLFGRASSESARSGSVFGNNSESLSLGKTQQSSSLGSIQSGAPSGNSQSMLIFGSTQGNSVFASTEGSPFANTQGTPSFGSTQGTPSFGNTQGASLFSSTQGSSVFGTSEGDSAFGCAKSGSFYGGAQTDSSFGNSQSVSSSGASLFTASFGNSNPSLSFGNTQTSNSFGANQSGTFFCTTQPSTPIGAVQSGTTFNNTVTGSSFGAAQSGTIHPGSVFGTSQSGPSFGTSQPGSVFGTTQSGPSFATSQPGSVFGTTQSGPSFATSQPGSVFGTTQSGPSFGTSQPSSVFGSTQTGPSFGTSLPSSVFGSTQTGPSFGTSQPSSVFGSAQSGPSFGTSQPGSVFGTKQSGPSFGTSQPGSVFGTQTDPSFCTVQSGTSFGTSQQVSSFGTPQSGTFVTSSQSNYFGNSVSTGFEKSKSSSIFGSTTSQLVSDNSTDKKNIFGTVHFETSADKTKPLEVFGGVHSSSSTFLAHEEFTFSDTPPSSVDHSKSVFGGIQSASNTDEAQKKSSESHYTASIFSSQGVNSGPSAKSVQHSHSVEISSTEISTGGSQSNSVFFRKGVQQPSVFGGQQVSSELYNAQRLSSGRNSIFSTSFPKSDSSSEPDFIKRPAQSVQGSSSLFGKSSAPGILPFTKESQMLQSEVVSTIMKPYDKTLIVEKSNDSEGQQKNVASFGKDGNLLLSHAKKRTLMSAFLSSHNENLEGKKLFGDSSSPSNLSGKDPAQLQEARLNRTASSYDLWQQETKDSNDHTKQQPSLGEEKLTEKDSSPLEKGKSLVWSRNTLERRKRPSVMEERKENKRSCTTSEQARSRLSSLRKSVEDVSSKKSLIVKEIPAQFIKDATLRNHFSQFGHIITLKLIARNRTAYITFETHEQAENAKREGKSLAENSPALSIFWRTNPVLKSPETKPKEGVSKTSKKLVFKRSAVEDELSSMAETCDFEGELSGQSSGERVKSRGSRRHSPTPLSTNVLSQPSTLVPDKDTVRELWKKIHQAKAKDSAGRIELLDARDRLLRILRGRQQSDLASAKAFSGTCPDMCPEKERYYREDIRRLALYEVLPNTLTSITGQKSKVDHSRAVKEYSRSSADQEEPLPHELRPLPVLVLTMNYLLSQVADQGGDGQWSEWYDFLWNRTRGIRKDITQQQLNNVQVAELLEKCTRFHIVCSERLCEEDMMTFDAKINNENLTKCLQTLKEIYADLEKKQVFCSNEAEFRGYMVLMNLNEGDTLREIQQLRSEIRASVSINFAVQAYNALNANNYVRFFRLIKQSSFLNACILHRYFNQIRGKALLIIMKALNAVNKNKVMYPVQELTRLLCFEDYSEAKEFCSYYNLNVEGNDVVMDSRAYLDPENSQPQRRSKSLVEAKLITSLGEAINGSPLPLLHIPTPSSSFDQDGAFIITADIQEALAASGLFGPRHTLSELSDDQVNIKEETVSNSSQLIADKEITLRIPAEIKKEKIAASNDVIKSLARTLILEVIDNSINEMATSVVVEQSVLLTEVHSILDEVTADIIRFNCATVFEEKERHLRKVIEEESMKQKENMISSLCDELVCSTVDVFVRDIAFEEKKYVQSELLKLSKERASLVCSQEILFAVVDEFIADISHDVYQVDVVAKNERLKATTKFVQLITCRKFFQCWKSLYLVKMKMKNSMLDFPSSPSVLSLSDQINKLVSTRKDIRISENSFYINDRAKLSIASPMEIIQQQLFLTTHLTMASARKMLASLIMWHPLDLSSLLGPIVNTALKSWLFEQIIDPDTLQLEWKLLVSFPDQQSSEIEIFLKWVKAKLCKNNNKDQILETRPNYEGQILTLYHINESHDRASSLGICVRCFHGHWTDSQEITIKKKGLLDGTNAILFITSSAEDLSSQNLQELTWKKDKKRLHQVLLQKRKFPALPLVILIPRLSCDSVVMMPDVDNGLELTHLYEQNLIKAVHLAEPFVGTQEQHLENYEEWTSQLTNCIKFTVNNMPVPPKLRVKPVSDFVEDAVVEFYKAPVYQDLRTRSKHQKLHQSPNTLLTLYNAVIEHISMVAASDTLTDISWPSPEFNQSSNIYRSNVPSTWNSEDHMCNLYELIGKMRLPYFHYSDIHTDDWSTVCQDVWSYINALTKKDSGSAKQCLFQEVVNLLSRAKKKFDQFCWLAQECGPCEPTYVNMAWTDLIDACIHYRMVSLRTGHVSIRKPSKEETEENETEDSDEPCVYYIEAELEDWQAPEVWLDALRDTEQSENGEIKSTILKAKLLKEESLLEESKKSMNTIQTTKQPAASSSAEWESLRDLFEKERILNSKLEQTLESLVVSECQAELNLRSPLAPFVVDVTPVVRYQPEHKLLSTTPNSKRCQYFCQTQQSNHLDPSDSEPPNQNNFLHSETSVNQTKDLPTVLADQLSTPLLNDKINKLQKSIQSQKEADFLFELNLKRLLGQ